MAHRSAWPRLLFAAAAVMLATQSLRAEVLDKVKEIAGTTLYYKVVLPKGYDPAKAYPAVLAFPGGSQTMDIVERMIEANWRGQAEKLGYIVIMPAAPDDELFYEKGARVFPQFLVQLLDDFKVLENKFHIAGISNGGLSAFHIAALYPQYFWSVSGLPGYLPDATPKLVGALAKMCIYMYAGEKDTDWLESEKEQAAQFRSQGFVVEFNEEKGQGHVMRTLEGPGAARLFKQFEQARKGCGK